MTIITKRSKTSLRIRTREKSRRKCEWVNAITETDMSRMLLTNLLIATVIAITWYLSDSIYLRFVILFIGVMNALYAIWDIFLDGIKYSTEQSDATLMVRMLSDRRRVSLSASCSLADVNRARKLTRHDVRLFCVRYEVLTGADYSIIWLSCQVTALLLSLIGALYWHKETIAQQAVESRRFLPSPNHYGAADLVDQTSKSISGLF